MHISETLFISILPEFHVCALAPLSSYFIFISEWYGEIERQQSLVCDLNYYTYNTPHDVFARLFGRGLLFNQLLHQLLFLNKKCPYNPIFDTIRTSRSTIRPLHRLLILGQTGIFLGTKRRNLIRQSQFWKSTVKQKHRQIPVARSSKGDKRETT